MRHIVVGTAGHIDHGKSALVLALTGTDPDRLKEEKARGITIDLGFAHWDAPGVNLAFVDVPGHERFVKNMLAGAGGLDAVMLVVAADESVMPQTREHFEICRLLQVRSGLVAITKADLADPDLIELVTLEVRELVRGSFLDGAPVIAVSSRTGAGLDDVRAALVDLARRVPARSTEGPARLPIDRVFSVKGFGTVVTGTLTSGRLGIDSDVAVVPGDRAVKVRGIQVHGEHRADAEAGQRVAVNVSGIEVSDIQRGQALVTPGTIRATRVCDVRIELLASARALRHGTRVRLHQGTTEVLGRVAVSSVIASAGADALPAGEVPPGRSAYVRMRLEEAAALTRGDRFILRAYSPPATIAGGVVVDPAPPKGGIRTAAGKARFERLDPRRDSGSAVEALTCLLHELGPQGLPASALVGRVGLSGPEADRAQQHLLADATASRIGDVLVARRTLDAAAVQLVTALTDYHARAPLEDGLPREEARERLFAHAAPGVFEAVIDDLVRAGRLVARDRLALSSHRLALQPDEAAARDALVRLFADGGLRPPDVKELAGLIGARPAVVEKVLALLIRQKTLLRVDTLLFHADALAQLKQDLARDKAAAPAARVTIDVAAFKERFGVSRKFAIPLLEYLDRERVTRRVGETRVLM